jgi:hypothetical protein
MSFKIVNLDELESAIISPFHIIGFSRYVDDCFLLSRSDSATRKVMKTAYGFQTSLRFTMEEPVEGHLNILDLDIKVHESNMAFNCFRKPARSE